MAWVTILNIRPAESFAYLNTDSYRYRVRNDASVDRSIFVNSMSARTIAAKSSRSLSELGLGTAVGNIGFSTQWDNELYLEQESLNTAPTQPGAFTQPTGELEIGDTRTISWGASTDAEGGFGYALEQRINGGAPTVLATLAGSNLSNSYTFVVPTANTIQFRVQAYDGNGGYSAYRESPTYTVTKPKYYWSKYNVAAEYTEPAMISQPDNNFILENSAMYTGYTFDKTTGIYKPVGQRLGGGTQVRVGDVFYEVGSATYSYLSKFVAKQNGFLASNLLYEHYTQGREIKTESRTSLIQSGLIAEEGTYPTDGRHTDGFWYVRGSRVNQSIAPTGAFSAPATTAILKPGQGVAVTFTASTAPNISLYELEYRYNSGLWTTLGTNNTALSRSFTPTTDKSLTNVQFRVRAKNTSNVYSDYVYSETFNIEHNAKPTLTLTTANNLILAETNTIVVAGQALDTDTGNVVNVYYQINTGNNVAIATGISNGTAPLPFSKTLTFKEGKLLDGTTVIASNLIENQTYTLKVWSEDNQGGKSDVQTRSFKVIPNRAPLLTVAAITQKTGLINNDTIAITGTVTDPENQTVKVKYKINGGALIQGYSGAGGNFSFTIKTGDLLTGDNTIELQTSDTYDLITTKKYKFTKVKNTSNLLTSVVRYKVTVPIVGTTGIVTWIERDNGDLTVTPSISMKMTGEAESYVPMEQQVSAPVSGTVTEDQYRITPDSAKTDVTLKLTLTKTAAASDKGVKKITGALQ